MKPDWKDAPYWAQWVAQDGDGDWYWHELKPHQQDGFTWHANSGRVRKALLWIEAWEKSLEPRP